MKALAVVLMIVAGCAADTTRQPEQYLAEAVVWRDTYHEERDPPPIEWIGWLGLNCAHGNGFLIPTTYGGQPSLCVGGVYWSVPNYAEVGIQYPGQPLSVTAYAHELLHAHLYYTTGDGDPTHSRLEWQPGGLLERANAELADVEAAEAAYRNDDGGTP